MAPVLPEPGTPRIDEERQRSYAVHPEFRNQYGLARINAHYAYARGATGEGVTLGIVDSGVDPSHPKFTGKLETANIGGYDPDFDTCDNPDPGGGCQSLVGHGTFVAGIMAGSRRAASDAGAGSASAVHGVAFDADVISVGFRDIGETLDDIFGENPTPEQIRDLPNIIREIEADLERQFASAFRRLNGRVTAVNASFGLPGNIEDFDAGDLHGRFPNVIDAIAQADTPAGTRTIYVWAAGNAGGEGDPGESVDPASSVEIVAGLPVRIPELRGHSLAVVATDREGRIAPFSSRCGIAKAFCLAAPGVDIAGPVPGFYCPAGTSECYLAFEEAGTSSAAPFVTGGIGLLAQHFRNQLGNDEIVERILAAADRSGVYADSDTYGQGFLDLNAATRPVGEIRMLTGSSLSGTSEPGAASVFHVGAAFGDSLTQALASCEVASFDELDAPFFRPLGDHLRRDALARPRLGDRLRALGHDPRGASWRAAGGELRLRLDPAPPRPKAAFDSLTRGRESDSSGPIPGSIGALSVSREIGNGRLLLGYRTHPGWRFGLHAGPSVADGGPVEPGTFTDDAAFANPFLGFARDGASIGFASTLGDAGFRAAAFQGTAQYGERRDHDAGEAAGVLAEYRFGNSLLPGLAVQGGWLAEPRGLVGSRSYGAFGALGANTVMAGLSAHRRLDERWSLLANAHAGMSRAESSGRGMVEDVSALWTGSFAVGLVGEGVDRTGGKLALRLSQPLRIEGGEARLRWVSGRLPDGRVTVEQVTLDLEPSGHQLDVEMIYTRPFAGGEAHLAAIASHDAGHVRGEHEAALMMRWRRAF